MSRFQIGAKPMIEKLLRITANEVVDYHNAFNEAFFQHLDQADLLSVDSDGSGQLELVYTITLKKGDREQALLSDLRKADESVRAQLIHGHSAVQL
jgi:hypothetical protein